MISFSQISLTLFQFTCPLFGGSRQLFFAQFSFFNSYPCIFNVFMTALSTNFWQPNRTVLPRYQCTKETVRKQKGKEVWERQNEKRKHYQLNIVEDSLYPSISNPLAPSQSAHSEKTIFLFFLYIDSESTSLFYNENPSIRGGCGC